MKFQVSRATHLVKDFNGTRKIINTILHIKEPCPCCGQTVNVHEIKEEDLEFYNIRFLEGDL
jgi:hypothetical protein